jgi:hypothetical protein
MSQTCEPVGFAWGRYSRPLARLYELVSTQPLSRAVTGVPLSMAPLVQLLWRAERTQPHCAWAAEPSPAPALAEGQKRVVLGFSGGKDSLAAALKLQAWGYVPVPLFVQGINRSYPQELEHAQALCRHFGWKLMVARVKLRGETPYKENPVKNQLLLALQLDLGLKLGTNLVAQGNLIQDRAADLNFTAGFSDAWEMFDAFQRSVPVAKVFHSLLNNESDSFITLSRAPEAFALLSSCMMPVRYKAQLTRRNEAKFKLQLLPGRCGSCYKCADEYLHMVALQLTEPNRPFMLHCLELARKAWPTIYGGECKLSNDALLAHFVDETLVDLSSLRRLMASA